MTELVLPHAPQPIRARIELGHWLAECGTPYCRNALHLDYGDGFQCERCGLAFDVIWPSPQDARRIVEVLRYRPDWANRNWLPGETLDDLLMENFAHGIEHVLPVALDGGAASTLWLDGLGRVQILDEPLVVDAVNRPMIGA